jgi:hypothetical protein
VIDYSAKVAALEAALASGELRVESDGDSVTYRSTSDLVKALDYFRAQQGRARSATTLAVYDPR